MKKFVFTVLAIALSFGTVSASEINKTTVKTTTEYYKVSTFCKLITAGNYEAVKAMIENGTNINRKSTGLTPLMFAARYNKVAIVKLLIKKGAKLKTKSDKGNFTALEYAKMSKAHESYKIIASALEK
ncbi:ankyrin repeat domain-containing protein [Tenacibaculum haliotis]|uniref:ankyrin repeat domain-containing protein n=1 Tax=Tenacibaculum haliotis TaxID=1888914 RepID=UPI0021AE5343|nr:ankyrin repeat domain-containing protein [Tenacibaculum haliotis]MCT4700204.1 ankyrin repeat domain-containing protein [Tenacibaculum haliotis]